MEMLDFARARNKMPLHDVSKPLEIVPQIRPTGNDSRPVSTTITLKLEQIVKMQQNQAVCNGVTDSEFRNNVFPCQPSSLQSARPIHTSLS